MADKMIFAGAFFGMILDLIPVAICILATTVGRQAKSEWHWIARLMGLGLVAVIGVINLTRYGINLTREADLLETIAPLWWYSLSSALSHTGWVLFAVGYFGSVLHRPKANGQSLGMPGSDVSIENKPDRLRPLLRLAVATAYITAGVLFLEIGQFYYFECSLIPVNSVLLGLPMFAAVFAFPFGAYEICRLPFAWSLRLILVSILVVLVVSIVGAWGPTWFLTHMCP